MWSATKNDRTASLRLLPFLLGSQSRGFCIGGVRSFPCASEEIPSALVISVPQNIGCPCLYAGTSRLILETAGFVGEGSNKRNRYCPTLHCIIIRLFVLWFGCFGFALFLRRISCLIGVCR